MLTDSLRELRVRSEQEGHGLAGVVLSMEGVNYIDTEGADVVRQIAEFGRAREIDLHLEGPARRADRRKPSPTGDARRAVARESGSTAFATEDHDGSGEGSAR